MINLRFVKDLLLTELLLNFFYLDANSLFQNFDVSLIFVELFVGLVSQFPALLRRKVYLE